MKVILDTNVLIDRAELIEKYKDSLILPVIVLEELDSKKWHKDIGYSARSTIRQLIRQIKDCSDIIFDSEKIPSTSPDVNIIMVAKKHNAKIITQDICMSIIAKSYGVTCELLEDESLDMYNPVIVDENLEFPFSNINLNAEETEDFKQYIQNKFDRELRPWDYYVCENSNGNKSLFYYNPNDSMLKCVRRNKIVVDNDITFSPLDEYQKMAINSICESDATLICGQFATGKSLIATATALHLARGRKVCVLRPTIKANKYDIGFLPGNKEEKLYEFFSGFMSALGFLYGNSRTASAGPGKHCSYDYIKEDLSKEKFEFLTMPELHGLSIQRGDILIVDEVQLIDRSYMQLLLSRICDGAKLIMLGDLNQTYSLLNKTESGLCALLEQIPHPGISMVELKNVYRNRQLANLAEKILK